jgi:TonB family protein
MRQGFALLAVVALLAGACATLAPPRQPPDPTRVYTLAEVDSAPRLRNFRDLVRRIERGYSLVLYGHSGTPVAVYSIEVNRDGRIRDVLVSRSAGSPRADSAMIRLLDHARFSPARIDTVAVRVRFDFPVQFGGARRARPPSP